MSSIIDENPINSQITSGSRSSILLSHVEFKRTEEDDDLMSAKYLQNKYNVLTNDNKFVFNNTNNNINNDLVVKMNGQNKINSNINQINGNNNENNSEGIADPKYVLYSRQRVLLEWKEPHKIGAGLTNMGNTCFLNSVLQCLTYCPPLVNYLLHTDDHNPNKCNLNFCMICEMSRHIRQTRIHSGEAIKPINICRRLKSIAKHFQFGRQEDAHEFLRYVIDNMWKSCLNQSSHEIPNLKLDPLSKETTAINQIFGGYHRSQVICLQCKAKSNTFDYFMDFMLDIKNVTSLERALDKFVAPEILQQEDAYKCTRCKRKVLAKKQFTVYRAPNVATFQFKRFDYNRIFGGKITKSITYPEKLNLRPYMSDNKGPPILYKLNSVLVHLGPTCNSGHYFCYVRNSNNSWYLMDDSRIIQVNQNQVLNQQAYVLFYGRIDTDFHRPTPVKNFISQTTPNGIKLSNISSPELAFRNQKLNNFSSHNVSLTSAQSMKKLNSPNNALKTIESDAIKQPQNVNKRKQNNSESINNSSVKGLVPYATDSSDEDCPKPSNHLNGSLSSNCDKIVISNSNRLPTSEHKSNDIEKSSPKTEKVENSWSKDKEKSTSNQNIPNLKSKINVNVQQNNASESMGCVPLAPITLKVKATTTSWHVVETVLRSPSIASNSSTNSVNSTTEWTVSDCVAECNGSQHSKQHRNKGNRNNKLCASMANGNVTQVLSTKHHSIPQTEPQTTQTQSETKTGSINHSNDAFETLNHSNEDSEALNVSQKKNEFKADNSSLAFNSDIESNESKFRENHQKEQHFDRKSISSHRSSNDSSRNVKIRNKESDRSHSKSTNNSDDEKSTTSSHKHEKRKHKRHKLIANNCRKSIDSDSSEENIKIKHKKNKKKLKKKKHKRKDSSESDSNDSDDNQLQWIERTKETVEAEGRTTNESDPYVRQWNENVRDLAKKRRLDEDVPQKHLNIVNNDSTEALNGLLKTTIRGYGDKVNSWNGGPSALDQSLNEEKRYNNETNDDYDDEFDRGKTKKLKTDRTQTQRSYDSNYNPFQKISTEKNRFNGSFSSHRNKPHFENNFKNKHNNNHKSWQTYHNRYDKERRH